MRFLAGSGSGFDEYGSGTLENCIEFSLFFRLSSNKIAANNTDPVHVYIVSRMYRIKTDQFNYGMEENFLPYSYCIS